jgi:hypothetical protein
MYRATIWLIAMVAALPAVAAAKDREPELLAHVGKWQVDYDKEACHLLGKFGEGEDHVIVRLTRYQPGDQFDLTLFGKRFRGLNASIELKMAFGSGPAVKVDAMSGTAGKIPLIAMSSLRVDGWQGKWAEAQDITPAQEAAIADATVSIPRRRPFRLGFGSLGKPLAAMRECQTNLVKFWGFDPQVQAGLSRRPTPTDEPAKWLRSSDFPMGSAMGGHNGIVQFRLDVDTEGKLSACHVLYRTEPDDFADLTCRALTKRVRFDPALDAAGTPVRSFYVNKVLWLAPGNNAD